MPWTAVLAKVKAKIKADDVPSLAAGVAFKIFLALFPALIAGVAIASYVIDPLEIADQLRPVMPPGLYSEILEPRIESIAASTGTAAVALVAGVLGGLWAASSAAATLVKALNRISGDAAQRGFLAQRLVALAVIVALGVVLGVVVALIIFGPQLRSLLLPDQLAATGRMLFEALRIVVVVGALILLFAFIYWIGPNRERPRWRWVSPGSAVGVLGWLVLSLAFSAFVSSLGNYEETYGSLAAVAITLLWLQLSMIMVLLGAEIDVQLEHHRQTEEVLAESGGVAAMSAPFAPAAGGPAAPLAAGAAPHEPVVPTRAVVGDPSHSPRAFAAAAGLAALGAAVALGVRSRR